MHNAFRPSEVELHLVASTNNFHTPKRHEASPSFGSPVGFLADRACGLTRKNVVDPPSVPDFRALTSSFSHKKVFARM